MQRVVFLECGRRGHITLYRVVQRRDIRRALDRGVATECHDARAGPADVPKEELQQRAGADDLDTVGVLRPSYGVGERGGPVRARIGQDRFSDFKESFLGAAGALLHHLRRVAGEMLLDDLENRPRVLQRIVAQHGGLH